MSMVKLALVLPKLLSVYVLNSNYWNFNPVSCWPFTVFHIIAYSRLENSIQNIMLHSVLNPSVRDLEVDLDSDP